MSTRIGLPKQEKERESKPAPAPAVNEKPKSVTRRGRKKTEK